MADQNEQLDMDIGQSVGDVLLELDLLEQAENQALKPTDPLQILYKHHPEAILDYQETILQKLNLKVSPPGLAITNTKDPNHKTQPFLTQFEKTRILGFRTNQIAQGARPFVPVPKHITKPIDIAKLELEQQRLPFIIKRPLPDGSFEYWRLRDLLIL